MANTKVTKILMRNGTELEWDVADSVATLEVGEIGVEIDTYRLKIGTNDAGPLPWAEFEYFAAGITSVQGVDSVHADGLNVDDVGLLSLDLDGIYTSILDKVDKGGDSMSGGLSTPTLEAGVVETDSAIVHGPVGIDGTLQVGDAAAFASVVSADGLVASGAIQGANLQVTNEVLAGGEIMSDSNIGAALDITAGGSLNAGGHINGAGGSLQDNINGPFIASQPEDIVTLAKLDGIVDDRVAISGDTMTGGLITPNIETGGILTGNIIVQTNGSIVGGLEVGTTLTVGDNASVGAALDVVGDINSESLHADSTIVADVSVETNFLQTTSLHADSTIVADVSLETNFVQTQALTAGTNISAGGSVSAAFIESSGSINAEYIKSNGSILARSMSLNDNANGPDTTPVYPFLASLPQHVVTLAKLEDSIAPLVDSVTTLDSLVGELDDTILYHDSVLTYHNGLLASLNGEIDGHTLRLDQLDSVTSDLADSITHLDTIKITQDEIPTAWNRRADSHRADGGKITRSIDVNNGNYKYTYTPSLPLAEIVDSVVGLMGGGPPYNDTQATEAINHFFDLILTTYQPNVGFNVDDNYEN